MLDFKLVGTLETVIRRSETPRERIAIGYLIAVHTQYGMAQSQRRASKKKFAGEVIPHLRGSA